jgi:hypothetical protein
MKNTLLKYVDTQFATDMLPDFKGESSYRVYGSNIRKEKITAKKYGLDYRSMRFWKYIYYFFCMSSLVMISNFLYDQAPTFVLAFVFTIWILLLLFYFPKIIVYRFSKKI